MNELDPATALRRARRALSPQPIADSVLRGLTEAAAMAPSCCNTQPWRMMVITADTLRAAVHDALAGDNAWAEPAPVYVLLATHPELGCRLDDGRDYALFDTGLAAENLMLQATAYGLVAHPLSGFRPCALKERLGIPEWYIVIALIAVAYPGEDSELSERDRAAERQARVRRPIDSVIWFDSWKAGDNAPPPAYREL